MDYIGGLIGGEGAAHQIGDVIEKFQGERKGLVCDSMPFSCVHPAQ